MNPRIFVSNLGFERIYTIEIALGVTSSNDRKEVSVIDRSEVDEHDLISPAGATRQCPMTSGEYVDIGSLEDVL